MESDIQLGENISATKLGYFLIFSKIFVFQASVCILLASLPLALSETGENTFVIGLSVGILAAGTVIARIACPGCMDRVPVGRLFITADVILLCAAIGYILTGATRFVMFPRMLHGAAFAFFTTAIGLWISHNVGATARGKMRGVEGALIGACVVVAPVVGLYLQARYGTGIVFYVVGVLAAVGTLMRPGGNERRPISQKVAVSEKLWLPFAGLAIIGAVQGVVQSFLPAIAHWKNDISLTTIFIVTGAAMIAGRLGGGWYSDVVGRIPVIRLGAIGTVTSMVALYSANAEILILCACAVFGAGIGAYATGSFTYLVDVTEGRPDQGGVLSGASLSWELGIFTGPVIVGLIGLSGGAPTITLACTALSGVLVVLSLSASRLSGTEPSREPAKN
jgi:hypothetical protein